MRKVLTFATVTMLVLPAMYPLLLTFGFRQPH